MKKPTKWTERRIRTAASKYETHTEFTKAKPGAYRAAKRLGILDEVCSHMPKKINRNNVVYMWSSKQYPNVWKIGVSSGKGISLRVHDVAEAANLDIEKIFYTYSENARKIESEILSTYEKQFPFPNKFDGYTEFRLLSEDEENHIQKTYGITRDNIKPVNDVLLNKGKAALERKKVEIDKERNTVDEWVYERIVKEVAIGYNVDCWKLYYPSSFNHKHLLYYMRHICDMTLYTFEVDKYSITFYDENIDINVYLKWLQSVDFSDATIDKWAESVNPPIQRKQNTIIHSKKWHKVRIPLENNNDEAYDEQAWCIQNTVGSWGSHKRVPIWDIDIELEWEACVVFYFDDKQDADKFSDMCGVDK